MKPGLLNFKKMIFSISKPKQNNTITTQPRDHNMGKTLISFSK